MSNLQPPAALLSASPASYGAWRQVVYGTRGLRSFGFKGRGVKVEVMASGATGGLGYGGLITH